MVRFPAHGQVSQGGKMIVADIILPAAVLPLLIGFAAAWAIYVTRTLINIKMDLHALKLSLGVTDKTPLL